MALLKMPTVIPQAVEGTEFLRALRAYRGDYGYCSCLGTFSLGLMDAHWSIGMMFLLPSVLLCNARGCKVTEGLRGLQGEGVIAYLWN